MIKPPLAGPRNKKMPSLTFDFEESDQKSSDSKMKMNQTSKNMFGSMSSAIQETEEDGLSDNEDEEVILEKKKFMNT